jgi:hypothetical protein
VDVVVFKDGDWVVDVLIRLMNRFMYGDSCDETLKREEFEDTPGLVLRHSRCKGKTYLFQNLVVKTMTFTAST